MAEKNFDIVIIGGGIHGAGTAQAGAAAGYSVLLLEMEGVGTGTSGRSSKLIHGGLRYLETAQFSLVAECLRERALLLKNAPGLVSLKKVHIPVYPETERRPLTFRAGLTAYYLLSGLEENSGFRTLEKNEWGGLDGLDTSSLQAVFQYHEAQTDDTLLTRAVMDSAISLGAELKVPARFTGASFDGGKWSVRFTDGDNSNTAHASFLVNAAGPWANMVLEKINGHGVPVDLVQGAHIVVEGELGKGIYYVESPLDHRGVFLMPWKGKTLIGTTETPFDKDPSLTAPLDTEVDYLLKTAARYFPRFAGLQKKNVVSAFAGLRVLPSGSGSAFHRSRETLLHMEEPKLLSIFGGKLTSYRATSESAIKRISAFLPPAKPRADTKTLRLG